MEFKILVLLALLNLSTAVPNPKVNFKVDVNMEDNVGPVSEPEPGTEPTRVKCGIVNKGPTRIVNGVDVDVARKYSWQVGLTYNKTGGGPYWCGGSIITDKHILTAAHCLCGQRPIDVYVGIGDHNQLTTTDNNIPELVKPILAHQFFLHDNYICSVYISALQNSIGISDVSDIAIVELSRPIGLEKHAEFIHPICLPRDDSETYAGLNATVSGWGSTIGRPWNSNVCDPFCDDPPILQETQVPVWENYRCQNVYGSAVRDSMICTEVDKGYENNGTSVCNGDSGGPLSVDNVRATYVQIGVVSWGAGCASEGLPAVYTRVSRYLDWIKIKVGTEKTYTLH